MSEPLANPFRKDPGPEGLAAHRPPPPPPVGPREWARLYIMAVVFFLALGLSIYFRKISVPKTKPAEKPAADEIDYSMRKGRGPETSHPTPGPQDPEKKKDVPLPPLPQGEVSSFKELAAPFRDGEETPVKETPEFITLLQVFLKNVKPEALKKMAPPGRTGDAAYRDPARHRGEVVRTYGRLIKIYTEPLNATTPDDIKYVYLGILQEYKTNRTVWFYLPELPKDASGQPIRFKTYSKAGQEYYEDWVEVHGVFLRTYDYASQYDDDRKGTVKARAAVLFARTLELSRPPQYTDTRSAFAFVVGLMAVIVVTIVLVAGIMSRKYGSGSLRMKMLRLKKEKGIEVFPKPDPEKQVLGDEVPKQP